MKILPWLAASAVDDPEIPAKKTTAHVDLREPAGQRADQARDSRTSRSVMPPTFIRFAVEQEERHGEQDERVVRLERRLNTTIGDSRGSMTSTGRHASPSANATGTRSTISVKNMPNSDSAATAGVSSPPVRRGPRSTSGPRGPRRAGADRRGTLAEEQDPREARQRPCDEDVGIGISASSEFWFQPNCTNLIPYQTKIEREDEDEHVRHDAQERVRASA